MADNRYYEDFETWEELTLGRDYTVEAFLDELHEPLVSAPALYPMPANRLQDDVIGEELDVPLYDHERGEIRVPAKNVETMMEHLYRRARKKDRPIRGKLPKTPEPKETHASLKAARRYGDYTLAVDDDLEVEP